ncbi:MAG: hypothetical protein ACI8RW_000055 [Porticoccaceae bacterium]|jgi:hypothetical protein
MTTAKTGHSRGLVILVLAALTFFVLNLLPFGYLIQWPFVIITTFVHEMGHGLMAILSGGNLIQIEIYQNASGLAKTETVAGWRQAAIAASGLLAPSVIGAGFIIAGKSRQISSRVFLVFSLFILISCVLWVRSAFGLLVLLPTGALFLWISQKGSAALQHFMIQFLGVHMLVDTLTRTMSYLFSSSALVDGQSRHSDTAAIAQQLIGGHLVWACIIALLSIWIFYYSLRKTYLSRD